MGHLSVVHTARSRGSRASQVQLPDKEDVFTTASYGSRFARMELPRHQMPESEMPRDTAYRLIKDHLSLDNNPTLNLASFVTTYMEDEAQQLMSEAFPKNFIDYEEYPQSADIQNRCVSIMGNLFHAPAGLSVGTSTIGSSEAIMLAVLAMKRRWKARRLAEGKATDSPNFVMSSAVQVVWEKAMRYFEIEERFVYCTSDRYVLDPAEAINLCDENTIGICMILGTTYTGEYEDVKDYLAEAVEKQGFLIMSERNGRGLPLVAFRFRTLEEGGEDRHYDEFALAHHLRCRGWVVPAYTMAPKSNVKMLRIVVREDFTRSRCDSLIEDLLICHRLLKDMDQETAKMLQEHINKHVTSTGKGEKAHPVYAVSLLVSILLFRPVSV
uniref:glutamate decarboxylase n=1 Tax=Fusarium oxysporum (strain Fo5176) TaxID=660025 RepID=A0A0D2Y1U2_FUSOF